VAVNELLVRTSGLSRIYTLTGEIVEALADVTIDIASGEAVAITGPSGSGKTTLLNIVGGLDRPSAGVVQVRGRDLTAMRSDELAAYRRETVGFVFQAFRLLPYLTAVENVALPLLLAGTRRAAAAERARAGLERVGLAARAAHKPSQLSAGEQQRVAVARAIANGPALLLADEPTGNLDDASARALLDLFAELRERDGLTLIVATHNAEVAARCEREIRLRAGRVVEAVAR
jgi:putative ABC transport system ATP-binding protein